MWRARHEAIHSRQAGLIARSDALRQRLGHESQALQRPLAAADRARNAVQWLKAHPQWLALVIGVPLVLRPRRAINWALKLWWGWRTWRRVQAALESVGRRGDYAQPP